MTTPTTVDIAHALGREEAKRRLASRTGEVANFIPGGIADVVVTWPSEYRLALEINALGQRISATLDIDERVVHVAFTLPGMLGFMAGGIASAIRERGAQVLLSDGRDPA